MRTRVWALVWGEYVFVLAYRALLETIPLAVHGLKSHRLNHAVRSLACLPLPYRHNNGWLNTLVTGVACFNMTFSRLAFPAPAFATRMMNDE